MPRRNKPGIPPGRPIKTHCNRLISCEIIYFQEIQPAFIIKAAECVFGIV